MYAQPGPSRLKSRRRGRRPPPVTEPHISYSELIDYLSSTDFSELEANVESFFVNLNRVALQLKDRNEAQVGNEEFFNLAFHKFLYLLNNKQSCVRTVVLRIFRLLLVKERVLQQYLHYRLDIVVLRALDMHLNGEAERIQALKMMVRMFEIYRKTNEPDRLHFRKSFLQSAVAVVRAALPKKSGEQKTTDEELKKGNRLWLGAFAFLLETSILEPKLVISSIGTEWLVRILMEPAITQRIVGQVCRILIAWLDCPVLRAEGRLNFVLEKLFSPLIEIGFFYQPAPDEDGKSSMSPRVVDTLEICSFVFLNIIRSWTGLYSCSALDDSLQLTIASPIRLLRFLGTGQVANPHLAKIRDMAIDICCQFVDLPYAEKKFATWNEALEYYATMHYPDRFKCGITQEFVLAEHTPVFNDHVDLLGSFRAAAVYVLVNAGLSQSLVRLILSVPDEPSGVKATLLLSDLLRTGASVLPRDWRIRLMSLASAATEDEEKAMILVYRLSQLNELILTRPTRTTIISNTELFVQNVNEPEKLPHEKTHSKKKSGHVLDERAVYSVLEEHLPDAVSHGVINWTKVDHVLQAFESDEGWRALKNCKHNDRCHTFFGEIVAFFLPHKGHLLMKGMEHEKFVVECGCRLFRLLAPLCDELHYRELLEHFVKDFADQIRKENLGSGVLALKNIMNTGAMHYFALIGAISSTKRGCEIMDHMMVFQIFLDFMNSTTPSEYVKLIVSCLDYSTPDSLARLILSTALTATSDTSRKWVIRFIGVSPAFKNRIYSDFISRNLIQRLGDSSPKVVRHVVKILHSWLPQNPGAYGMLNLLGPSLKTHGDAGVLLKTHIYSSEEMTFKNMNAAEEFLRFWDTRFNDRYVEVVEDEVRSTLTSVRRTMHGTFGRPSNERDGNWSIPVPIHLFGVLARHKTGLSLLKKARIVEELLTRLREVTWMTYETDGLPIKAALLGLAHIIGNVSKDPRISEIVPPETVPIIARFAEECQLLSVRGTALWAMNIIGAGEFGALQLAKIGWESNRHQDALEEVQQGLYEFVPSPRIHLPCFESGPNRPHGLETVREESESDEPTSVDLEESLLNAATMMRLVNVDQDPEAHFSSAYRSQIGMKKLSTTRKLSYLPTDRQVVATDVYREIVEGTKSLVSRQATAMHSMWSYVSFPCEVYLMTEDVFRKAPLPKKLSTSSMGRNENRNFHFDHNYKICFHCKGSRNARDPLDENVRNDTLQNINLMEILSKSQEKKLFQTYRSNRNVFKNRCLYADVLELLSERKYRLGTRSLLHQLFWKAFQVEL